MDYFQEQLELIKTFLPKYLSPEQQEKLFKDIKEDFPCSKNPNKIYIVHQERKVFYQGDGVIDIPFIEFNEVEGKFNTNYYSGAILSNTCDVALEDKERLDEPYFNFAAIIPLKKYIELLKNRKIKNDRIISFQNALKNNEISNLFYLPELKKGSKVVIPEAFIRFDYSVSIPSNLIYSQRYDKEYYPKGDRICTLSNYGFYLFIFKLSIHYCRFRENVFRD